MNDFVVLKTQKLHYKITFLILVSTLNIKYVFYYEREWKPSMYFIQDVFHLLRKSLTITILRV